MRKKIMSLIMATSMMVVSLAPNIVFAGNTSDTNFSLSVPIGGFVYTSGRQKTDTSSTYVCLTSVPQAGRVKCQVQGEREYNNTGMMIWYNENVGGEDVVITGGKWFIRQNVYEDGARVARLRFQLYAANPGKVVGQWSPDSVAGSGSYAN